MTSLLRLREQPFAVYRKPKKSFYNLGAIETDDPTNLRAEPHGIYAGMATVWGQTEIITDSETSCERWNLIQGGLADDWRAWDNTDLWEKIIDMMNQKNELDDEHYFRCTWTKSHALEDFDYYLEKGVTTSRDAIGKFCADALAEEARKDYPVTQDDIDKHHDHFRSAVLAQAMMLKIWLTRINK